MTRLWTAWGLWLIAAVALTLFLMSKLTGADARVFMPGETTHGHYQIELQCSACHGQDLSDPINNAKCMACHEEELDRVDDSHPINKFKDPRKEALLIGLEPEVFGHLDQRFCIACHTEHVPKATGDMGLTLPKDYCAACHMEVLEDRPSHKGLGMDSCATAGCHNFHDNSGLYEDLFVQHINDPKFKRVDEAVRPLRDFAERYASQNPERQPLTFADHNAPDHIDLSKPEVKAHVDDWAQTAHAAAGINCLDCHTPAPGSQSNAALASSASGGWIDQPTFDQCAQCHDDQVHQFKMSRHGMRAKGGYEPELSLMTPGMARLPMKPEAHGLELDCVACHGAHGFDTQFAAFDACIQCHDDSHTNSYVDSKHFGTWRDEQNGTLLPGAGVSCATCHLPRETLRVEGEEIVRVNHNQNDFLRPNEKMLRPICMNCHGMAYAIDALADESLIDKCFVGRPKTPHFEPTSMDMVRQKLEKRRKP